MRAVLQAVEYHLPEKVLTNADLARQFPEWGVEKIADKTGIDKRHVAAEQEFSSDLAYAAARKLFANTGVKPEQVDYVLFCTQTPDYALPTGACLLQHRLGIPTTAGALDINLGCSGYVYGLSLCKALIESGQARTILFLTGETYTKLLAPGDKTVRTIFGDAGAATLVRASDGAAGIGPVVFGTDGAGGSNLICTQGGFRRGAQAGEPLTMNGPEIFNFTLRVVPDTVERLLTAGGIRSEDVKLFIFHQANRYMLDHLRKKLALPAERFFVSMAHCGNTVSCSIPIALKDALDAGRLQAGDQVMLVGFGVGYSWGGTLVRW
jgi:3-oxoacyl-[acyl-carrier-protein] synthase III